MRKIYLLDDMDCTPCEEVKKELGDTRSELKKEITGLKKEKNRLAAEELTRIIRRANAVGALRCTGAGAMPPLPTTSEVDAFLEGIGQ